MTQEEKDLLLQDLCARLPYGVFCNMGLDYPLPLQRLFVDKLDGILLDFYEDGKAYQVYLSEVKPYLRPMSSMTKEERVEFSQLLDKRYCEEDWEGHISTSYCIEIDDVYIDDEGGIKYPSTFRMDAVDWLNAHHFDYRGLIEKGLAIEVTKENNPYEN